jgi:hypothetical protein
VTHSFRSICSCSLHRDVLQHVSSERTRTVRYVHMHACMHRQRARPCRLLPCTYVRTYALRAVSAEFIVRCRVLCIDTYVRIYVCLCWDRYDTSMRSITFGSPCSSCHVQIENGGMLSRDGRTDVRVCRRLSPAARRPRAAVGTWLGVALHCSAVHAFHHGLRNEHAMELGR